MNDAGVRTAVEGLVQTDLSVADHAELSDAARAVARLQSFVDHAKVQIARRGRQLAAEGDTSSAHTLIDEGRCTGTDAKHTDGRDRVCGDLPEFEGALASGTVTGAHLDALAHHTKSLTDEERSDLAALSDELVADAAEQPPALFDRTVKGRIDAIRNQHRPDSDTEVLDRQRAASCVKRWTDRDTGMKNTMLSLDPVRDASLWNVIDHHLARPRNDPANAERPFAQLQVEAVLASVAGSPGDRRIPEIVAHVDHGSLCHGRHADTLAETADGTALPVATVQRLCCEAIIQAVVVHPDGTVDQLCAEQRTANRRQRRMLEAMYSTCAHPHCSAAFTACRIHHVTWWTKGGKTVLAKSAAAVRDPSPPRPRGRMESRDRRTPCRHLAPPRWERLARRHRPESHDHPAGRPTGQGGDRPVRATARSATTRRGVLRARRRRQGRQRPAGGKHVGSDARRADQSALRCLLDHRRMTRPAHCRTGCRAARRADPVLIHSRRAPPLPASPRRGAHHPNRPLEQCRAAPRIPGP